MDGIKKRRVLQPRFGLPIQALGSIPNGHVVGVEMKHQGPRNEVDTGAGLGSGWQAQAAGQLMTGGLQPLCLDNSSRPKRQLAASTKVDKPDVASMAGMSRSKTNSGIVAHHPINLYP
ncbi:hypothetical protein G7046_g6728 [Stylonectria norvegica]|nr:hypothetical protein G7046_g6728 [Stylonectria norvegica]